MNYFEFYKIPVSFFPDEQDIRRNFYHLSKEYHPDYYINHPSEKQEEVMQLSTLNNKAYAVLSSFSERTAYILELHGLLEPGDRYALPQSFLLQMMEINETLMELSESPDERKLSTISMQLQEFEHELDVELKRLAIQFDKNAGSREKILAEIKDLYYRKKYLLRIRDSLNKFAD